MHMQYMIGLMIGTALYNVQCFCALLPLSYLIALLCTVVL